MKLIIIFFLILPTLSPAKSKSSFELNCVPIGFAKKWYRGIQVSGNNFKEGTMTVFLQPSESYNALVKIRPANNKGFGVEVTSIDQMWPMVLKTDENKIFANFFHPNNPNRKDNFICKTRLIR